MIDLYSDTSWVDSAGNTCTSNRLADGSEAHTISKDTAQATSPAAQPVAGCGTEIVLTPVVIWHEREITAIGALPEVRSIN